MPCTLYQCHDMAMCQSCRKGKCKLALESCRRRVMLKDAVKRATEEMELRRLVRGRLFDSYYQ